MTITTADIDRLRNLSAMLKPLAELPALLDQVVQAEQIVRERQAQAAKIATENEDAMQTMASVRDQIKDREKHAAELLASAKARAAAIEEDAVTRRDAMLDAADLAISERRVAAESVMERLKQEAATIDATLADKRSEVAKLEKRVADAKAYLKRLKEE